MTAISKNALDPFRALLGVLVGMTNSDKLINAISTSGLRFSMALSKEEAYSHQTRVRAFQPRILDSYDLLDDQSKLAVADAVLTTLIQNKDSILTRVTEILQRIGWAIHDDKLVVTTPELREMFFPKGSPWDAFVVLRDLFAEAQTELIIVDSYCDGTVFQMLKNTSQTSFRIKILCSQYASSVAAEARTFISQYPTVIVEVRKTRDFHDRFVVIDEKSCVHIGASIKDAGKTAFMISRIEDQKNRADLLININTSWTAATIEL